MGSYTFCASPLKMCFLLFGRWCCDMPFDGESDLLVWALANQVWFLSCLSEDGSKVSTGAGHVSQNCGEPLG